MKSNRSGFLIQALVIFLLLAAVGASCYIMRSDSGSLGGRGESATVVASHTKASDRAAPDPERERRRKESIDLAAQKWYEELLEKYPQMKPAFRDVPDEQNGFLHFLLLAESMKERKLSQELTEMLRGRSPWDAGKFKAWLAENEDYRDLITRIAELPDQSTKGLDLERLFSCSRVGTEFGIVLSGSARLAFEAGDREAALRYARASASLGGHLTDIEAPSVLGAVLAAGYQSTVHDMFVENILPALSNDPQALASWREALLRKQEPAGELSRILSGEWNVVMRTNILPALLGENPAPPGESSFQIPDNEGFFDEYTAAFQRLADGFSNSGPGRLDLSHGDLEFSEAGIDPKTLEMLRANGFAYQGLFGAFGVQVTRAATISAAISIQLGEVPPVDPVSGKPFRWDPQSRTISSPEGFKGPDPIKLP